MRKKTFTFPIVGLGLGLAVLAAGCDTGPQPTQAGPSPTLAALETMDADARTVAEKVVGFVGGARAIDAVQTLEVRFEGQSDGHPIVFHLAWSRSGPAWYGMRLGPDSGRTGTNGTHYWQSTDGEGAELYEIDPDLEYGWNETADQVVAFAAFALDVINPTNSHWPDRAPLGSNGMGEFKGQRAALLVLGEDPDMELVGALHVDPATGRPLGVVQGLPSEPLYMAFSDWREVDGGNGLKMFHRVKVDGFWLGDEVFDLKATVVRVNTLTEKDFAPPADAVLQTDG